MGTRSVCPSAPLARTRDARMLTLPSLVQEDTHVEDFYSEYDSTESFAGYGAARNQSAPVDPVAQTRTRFSSASPLQRPHATALRRVTSATTRLAQLGTQRPVVRIPTRGTSATPQTPARQAKLPPIWLLANLVILLVAGIAVVPRIVSADAAAGCLWHTVVPGDTLGDLGAAHHTNALALARANHITNPNLIYVGQRLCIPMTEAAHAASAPAVPNVAHPPTYGSAAGVQSFVQFALPYARQAHAQTSWPMSLILAQWGLEHGWKIPGYTGFNWGNSGAVPGFPTVGGLNVPGSPTAFAYARTPNAGVQIYVHCAHLSYYRAVAQQAANGPDAAARALGASPWDAGHYTGSNNPGSSLVSLMRVYNLYYYDTH